MTPNPALEALLAHHSIRAFVRDKPLPERTLELLVAAGQSAATSSNLQTWSVVSLTDSEIKRRAAVLSADQAFIHEAPLFLIFCTDLQRLTAGEALAYTEIFLMASIEAALASQNVSVAAEALGLGACYVGAVRNRPREMAELLGLPERVIALFGTGGRVARPAMNGQREAEAGHR